MNPDGTGLISSFSGRVAACVSKVGIPVIQMPAGVAREEGAASVKSSAKKCSREWQWIIKSDAKYEREGRDDQRILQRGSAMPSYSYTKPGVATWKENEDFWETEF